MTVFVASPMTCGTRLAAFVERPQSGDETSTSRSSPLATLGSIEPSRRPALHKVPKLSWSERIDRVLTHPIAGISIFAVVMFGIFEALFAGAEPLIGAIETFTGFMQAQAAAILPPGVLRDLVVEGIIAGVGNVIVFAPQILMLFLFIGFLEDSGYLARVAFVIDRVMKGVGLHGKAFVPLLSGFACAVPAVMATRTIERRRDRLVTMLALPLMSCSARLPIYILVVGTVFAGQSLGWFSAGAVALFSMYTLSVLVTLAAAAVLRRTVLPGPAPTFVLEMPPYRWPSARILWINAWRRLRDLPGRRRHDHLGDDDSSLGPAVVSKVNRGVRALRHGARAGPAVGIVRDDEG